MNKQSDSDNSLLKKEVSTLKYDNKRQAMDLKDAKERFEKVRQEYQAQFKSLKQTIVSMKTQMTTDEEKKQELEEAYLQVKQSMDDTVHEAETRHKELETQLCAALEDLEQSKLELA